MSTLAALEPSGAAVPAPTGVENEARLLEALATAPGIASAVALPSPTGGLDLQVAHGQRDLAGDRQRRFVSTVHLPVSAIVGAAPTFGLSLPHPTRPDVVLTSHSPSGRLLLVARRPEAAPASPDAAPAPTTLEVWGGGRLLLELDVPSALHGAPFDDGWFSGAGPAWSDDESRVCYVAEAPRGDRTPEWGGGDKPAVRGDGGADGGAEGKGRDEETKAKPPPRAAPKGWRGRGRHRADWGEGFRGRATPRLFVLDLSDDAARSAGGPVAPVAGIDPQLSCGQPIWSEDGAHIVFTGWGPAPGRESAGSERRLGIIYCMNRPSALWCAPAPPRGGDHVSAGDRVGVVRLTCPTACPSAHSPRLAPDGRVVVFLSHDAAVQSGVHNATAALRWLPWPAARDAAADGGAPDPDQVRTVVGVVHAPDLDRAVAAAGADAAAGTTAAAESPPEDPVDAAFPGLYLAGLPRSPFLQDGHTLVLGTQWRSDPAVVAVDTRTGDVTRLSPPPPGAGSWRLLDVGGDVAVCAVSTPAAPDRLAVGRRCGGTWVWEARGKWGTRVRSGTDAPLCLSSQGRLPRPTSAHPLPQDIPPAHSAPLPPLAETALAALEWQVLRCPCPPDDAAAAAADRAAAAGHPDAPAPSPPPPSPPDSLLEAIVLRRADLPGGKPGPAILVPHGGPHGAHTTGYVQSHAFLAALGYTVVAANYRGSVGFGEGFVQALPGRCGELDVADCVALLDTVIERGLASSEPGDAAVVGGSHGGFLAGHLVGQRPDRFRAAVLRNPVCNLALMAGVSDIPDWVYVEALGVVAARQRLADGSARLSAPSAADLAAFRAASPIRHVDSVRAPCLFLLGDQDARVPPQDGMRFLEALRDRGVVAEALLFPQDRHPLDRPRTDFESFVSCAAWLKEHVGAPGGVARGGDDE